MKQRRIFRRVEALLLACGTLWLAAVTAGSENAASAWEALGKAAPLGVLQWELGDFRRQDGLSAAAALAIGQSPLLLAAGPAIADYQALNRQESPEEDGETTEPAVIPVEETPLDPAGTPAADNGVPAKTLVPSGTEGYTVCGRTYISNSTQHVLSIEDLQQPFDARLGPEEPQILILHTHGSEAYTPAPGASVVWSGNYRTTDCRWNVVRAGDEMAAVFHERGISVLHDRTLYDYPSYSGAYDRSLAAIQSYLAQYPSIRFILDVHRDAIEDGQGNQYKAVSEIEGLGTAAQMTLVLGSDGSGLEHPRWMENLRLGVAIQEEALRQYPTLMRPLLLRNSRYNQHAVTGSLLVEVGAAGNSPEEAALSARLFAESMSNILEAQSK